MANVRNLRWMMAGSWLKDNGEGVADAMAFPLAIYFGACREQRGFLFGPPALNWVVLWLFALWFLHVLTRAWVWGRRRSQT